MSPPQDPEAPESSASSARRQVVVASLILIGAIFVSRISGMARVVAFSYRFGASGMTSAYNQAFGLPDLVNMLIGGGVVASALVPFFSEHIAKGEEDKAWRSFSAILTALLLGLVLLVGAMVLLVPFLVEVFVPSSEFAPEHQRAWVEMTRIMMPAQIFFVTGGLFMGVLNSYQHFWAPAVGPTVYNLVVIGGIMLLGEHLGVKGPALTVPLGAFIGQWAIQIPVLVRKGAQFRPNLDFSDPGLRRVFLFMAPVTLGLSVIHINMLVARALSGQVSAEGPTYFENAYRIVMLPVGVFAMGAAMAAYPTIASAAARMDANGYRRALGEALRRVMFLTIPSMAILMIARRAAVDILFGHGKFSPADVDATASALLFYAPGVIGMSAQQVLIRGFYALNDSRTPVYAGVAGVGVALGLGAALQPVMGVEGLCLALSVSAILVAAAMWCLLGRRSLARGALADSVPSIGRCLAASAFTAASALAGQLALDAAWPVSRDLTRQAAAALAPIATGLGGLAVGVMVFRVEEGVALGRVLARKLLPRRGNSG